MSNLIDLLGAEALAPIESALGEMATRRAWGQVIVHFREGRPYEIRVVETRVTQVVKRPGRGPSCDELDPAA